MSNEPTDWIKADDAMVTYEALPDWHPSLFVDVLRTGLEMEQANANELLGGAFVTPGLMHE